MKIYNKPSLIHSVYVMLKLEWEFMTFDFWFSGFNVQKSNVRVLRVFFFSPFSPFSRGENATGATNHSGSKLPIPYYCTDRSWCLEHQPPVTAIFVGQGLFICSSFINTGQHYIFKLSLYRQPITVNQIQPIKYCGDDPTTLLSNLQIINCAHMIGILLYSVNTHPQLSAWLLRAYSQWKTCSQ